MKKLVFLILSILLFSCSGIKKNHSVYSPDKKIEFQTFMEDGKFLYQIKFNDSILIKKSGFGFDFKDQSSFSANLKLEKVETSTFDETWTTVCGFSDSVRNHYNQAVFTLSENNQHPRKIQFIVRVYDDGVGFRYEFPKEYWSDSLNITAENTEFSFSSNDSAWWLPSNEFAYESLFRHTSISEIQDANTPFTIETKSGYFMSIHEAALQNYSEMVLKKDSTDSLSFKSSLWPESDGVCVRVSAPFKTPWRTVQIAEKPGQLIESHLIANLNESCKIQNTGWIKPLKFNGIWWGMHIGKYTWFEGPNHGATTERMKKYIDFAAEHNLGGVLAEGWNKGWETWMSGVIPLQDFCKATDDFDLEEVIKYAKSKNIEFVAHNETGANIPEYERQIDSAFQLYHSLGIHYLKTGYAGSVLPEGFHHHGQFMVNHFQKVVELAAKYEICLDAHEAIKPTGLDRIWPNLMSQEAIRGNEWNATYKQIPPYHTVILPFTRFLAGPADYTPGIFNVNHSPEKNKRLYCTLTNQLALFVVFYSPMMMVSDMIENYENKPAFEFIENVPCSWDETKVIDTKLGDYISIARRKGKQWFIGSITDENCRIIRMPLTFLENGKTYVVTIYGDSIITNWDTNPEAVEIGKYIVTSRDTIIAALSKAGGNSIIITPVDPRIINKLPSIAKYNSNSVLKLKEFEKITPIGNRKITHLALNKPITIKNPFSSLYPASGKNALNDGERGTFNFSDAGWHGYESTDIDATIDLQQLTEIHSISAGFLNSPNDWIFYPVKIEYFVSDDGIKFQKVGEKNLPAKKPIDLKVVDIQDFSVDFKPIKARFVKVYAENIKTCPPWHYGAGGKAWLFCDEIIVK